MCVWCLRVVCVCLCVKVFVIIFCARVCMCVLTVKFFLNFRAQKVNRSLLY